MHRWRSLHIAEKTIENLDNTLSLCAPSAPFIKCLYPELTAPPDPTLILLDNADNFSPTPELRHLVFNDSRAIPFTKIHPLYQIPIIALPWLSQLSTLHIESAAFIPLGPESMGWTPIRLPRILAITTSLKELVYIDAFHPLQGELWQDPSAPIIELPHLTTLKLCCSSPALLLSRLRANALRFLSLRETTQEDVPSLTNSHSGAILRLLAPPAIPNLLSLRLAGIHLTAQVLSQWLDRLVDLRDLWVLDSTQSSTASLEYLSDVLAQSPRCPNLTELCLRRAKNGFQPLKRLMELRNPIAQPHEAGTAHNRETLRIQRLGLSPPIGKSRLTRHFLTGERLDGVTADDMVSDRVRLSVVAVTHVAPIRSSRPRIAQCARVAALFSSNIGCMRSKYVLKFHSTVEAIY